MRVKLLFASVLSMSTLSDELINPKDEISKDSRPIVAIGDLHGDWHNTIKVLLKANLIKKYDQDEEQIEKKVKTESDIIDQDNRFGYVWNGHDTILVQTGDIVDRRPSAMTIYQFLQVLKNQARKEEGDVVLLLGNHELMNFRAFFIN